MRDNGKCKTETKKKNHRLLPNCKVRSLNKKDLEQCTITPPSPRCDKCCGVTNVVICHSFISAVCNLN